MNLLKTKVNDLKKDIADVNTLIHISQYNTGKQNLAKLIGDVDKKVSDTSSLVTKAVLN